MYPSEMVFTKGVLLVWFGTKTSTKRKSKASLQKTSIMHTVILLSKLSSRKFYVKETLSISVAKYYMTK